MYQTKQLLKIASRIHEAMATMHQNRYVELLQRLSNSVGKIQAITKTGQQLGVAVHRNWLAAAEACRDRMNRNLNTLANQISDLQRLNQAPRHELPSLRMLYEELMYLQEEFDTFHFDFKENRLSVETEPVDLEDVYLGPFQIQLEIPKLQKHLTYPSYYILARDPHPASGNDEVTHPHVSADRLCEGDGAAAINMALYQGRLVDFFTLVSNILHTYNPDSAYVSLANWDSRSCYECGTEISEDEVYTCQFCDREFCDGCSSYCHSCDTTGCLSCLDCCPVCEERVCHDCLKTCKECGEACCLNCLDDQEKLCPTCKERKENEDDSIDGTDEPESETRIESSEAGKDPGNPCQTIRAETNTPAAV